MRTKIAVETLWICLKWKDVAANIFQAINTASLKICTENPKHT